MATTPARPLPRTLRAELEEAFGADLGDVRVHESAQGAPLAFTRGEDVHFASGAFDPADREVIAHEVAHVLQQRFGRVLHGSEPSLEAEAAAVGRAFAAGRPVRIPGGFGGRPTPATQYYGTGTAAVLGVAVVNGAHHGPPAAQDSFISQVKAGTPSFLNGAAIRLASADPATVTLRLSAGGNMAIEHMNTSARQPKVFYATQAVVDDANDRLALLDSHFRLVTDPPGPAQRRITNGAATLLRVSPRNVANGTAGLAMSAEQSCNALFDAFVGTTGPHGPQPVFAHPLNPVAHQMIEFHIARELLAPPKPPYLPDGTDPVKLADGMRTIAIAFGTAARAASPGFVADLHTYGLNQYAAPEVGEGFVTCSLLATPPGSSMALGALPQIHDDHYQVAAFGGPQVVAHARSWTSHYGGVVARDGADVVTLENYARNVEDALATNDQRHYFQMYDTNPPAGGARSWHDAWANTPMQAIPGPIQPATHEPVSPGARGFTNPVTFGVSAPDVRYDAIAAAAHGAAILNTIKNDHNLIAGAPSAHSEILHVLKGLHWANTLLAAGTPGDALTVDAWRAAVHATVAVPRYRGNLQALVYTYGRLMRLKKA